MPSDTENWSEFRKDLESRSGHLAAELAGAWKDLAGLVALQRTAFASRGESSFPHDGLQGIDAFFREAGPALLTRPVGLYLQKRPLQRSLAAIDEYESSMGDVLRRLPKLAELSDRDLGALTGAGSRSALGLWRSLHRKPKAVRLRESVSDHLLRAVLSRTVLDGAFQQLLARASLHLLIPWQTYRRAFLASAAQSDRECVDLARVRRWWNDVADRQESRAALLLSGYTEWAAAIPAEVAGALLERPRPVSARTRAKWEERHQQHLSYWARQQRAIRAVVDLEQHVARLAVEAASETSVTLERLEAEHGELIQELGAAINWLENAAAGSAEPFPQPKARLLSSDERVADWLRRVSLRGREELPVTIEVAEPRLALAGWRKPWRDVEPAKTFLRSLDAAGAPVLLGAFREVEEVHRGIVREIERAREVVDFGLETARLERGAGEQIAGEALRNALELLRYQARSTPDMRPAVEGGAVRSLAAVLLETDIALEKSRVGLLARLTRRRGGELLHHLRGFAATGVRAGSRMLWVELHHANRWLLLKIGWMAAPSQPAAPVVRRVDLADTLDVQLYARDLPMIYRRLFRLAPVEDPRFLVGRDAEMAGFADARRCWEAGKGASVIVVGARGSGKTSLINCAASVAFSGCELLRGQFCERLVTPAQMAAFIRELFRIPGHADIVAALGERRRVVLVEEFERTFLRNVSGFEALKTLLDLMYSTGRSILWVFSVNETAYRYLEGVVGLGRHFSHLINAMSVNREDLTNAILQRHSLSGLRLEFARLPQEDPRVSGIRRFLGLEQDPRKMFLEALYDQSEGIFRAAFELWQGSIERVEGGIVHMRQPLAPDYGGLGAQMTLEDCFMLKAILQHGSLTAEELACVLASREDSVRQLERLHLLDVLEPEPGGLGVRVRPEAGRLVRETLSRRNLM